MWVVFLLLLLLPFPISAHAEDLVELSANPLNPDFTANPFGGGNLFSPNSVTYSFSPTVWR